MRHKETNTETRRLAVSIAMRSHTAAWLRVLLIMMQAEKSLFIYLFICLFACFFASTALRCKLEEIAARGSNQEPLRAWAGVGPSVSSRRLHWFFGSQSSRLCAILTNTKKGECNASSSRRHTAVPSALAPKSEVRLEKMLSVKIPHERKQEDYASLTFPTNRM